MKPQVIELQVSFKSPLTLIDGTPQPPVPGQYRAITTFQQNATKVTGENMSATMQVHTYATVSVEWKDVAGNTVKVDGPTEWKSSDESILEVEVATGNPQIANLYAPGPIGPAQVHATADADLGEGVKAVTATLDVQVISGQAVSGDIKFSQSPAQGPQKGGKAEKPAEKPAEKTAAKK